MDTKKLKIRVVLLIFFILFFNLIAMSFHWYYLLWWLDMPMHFLGGLWLTLAVILFIYPRKNVSDFVPRVILVSLLVFIFWEIFQIIVKNEIGGDLFDLKDTLSDICFDLAGGFTAIFYFFKRIKLN